LKQVSAVLICCNEEAKIEQALASLQGIADETIVVDSGSTDGTLAICRRHTERIYQRSWRGYREQKQFATDLASYDWVLSLDADEMLSPELRVELQRWKCQGGEDFVGYTFRRKTLFMGRWIEHTTWYPDWQLRLFRRSAGRWEGGRVHESFRVSGPIGRFEGHLFHYTYSNLSEFLEQLEKFSSLAAADLYDRGRRMTVLRLLGDPFLVFAKNYVLKLGFLDGAPGLLVSILSSVSTLFKHLKLWEISHGRREGQSVKPS
jgi:glycosyltransferase involved in cell wall biosynthesis